ncbi:MAG: mechanosensitive ion channel [Candidatus Accumulibacter sp.]|nr:mechanosensitive ion channel [Accumulibacter sp.]
MRIGEVTGDVTQVRLQVTHLRTLKNEEVTIPNSQILNGHVMNYSSLAKKQGLILPRQSVSATRRRGGRWRRCCCRRRRARRGCLRNPHLRNAQGTRGFLRQLRDQCLLQRRQDDGALRVLNSAATSLDLFNEYDVQIMTPAYEGDPKQPKGWSPGINGMRRRRSPTVDDAPATASGTQRPLPG